MLCQDGFCTFAFFFKNLNNNNNYILYKKYNNKTCDFLCSEHLGNNQPNRQRKIVKHRYKYKYKYKQQYLNAKIENILFIIKLKLFNFVCVTVYAYL